MILGYGEIIRRIGSQKILEDFEEENIGGAGVDLRLKAVYKQKSEGMIGKTERVTPDVEELEDDKVVIEPGKYFLVETMEKVNMPDDLMARVLPRSSLFRCGASLRNAVVDPGYTGTLTFGLKNEGEFNFLVEKGARICQIVFETVQGETKPYDGKYQGGQIV